MWELLYINFDTRVLSIFLNHDVMNDKQHLNQIFRGIHLFYDYLFYHDILNQI